MDKLLLWCCFAGLGVLAGLWFGLRERGAPRFISWTVFFITLATVCLVAVSFRPGGSNGDDYYDGGEGVDTINFAGTTSGVIVDLGAGTATGAEIGVDTLANIENITGGRGDDRLTGSAMANELIGGGGYDALAGRAGSDVLTGGRGPDTFTGTLAELDGDTITDFTASDRLVIEGNIRDRKQVEISEESGNTYLRFLDGSGNVDSTLRLSGVFRGSFDLMVDGGQNTILRISTIREW